MQDQIALCVDRGELAEGFHQPWGQLRVARLVKAFEVADGSPSPSSREERIEHRKLDTADNVQGPEEKVFRLGELVHKLTERRVIVLQHAQDQTSAKR